MAPVHPQLEFLITASNPALESFELSHLNRRAMLRKEAHELMDKWADAEVEARFARWILDCRRAGDAGSPDRLSLAEHSPDLFPKAPSDTPAGAHPGAPPDTPTLPSTGGAPIPGPRRLARATPQFPRRANESSPAAIAPVSHAQLDLSLAFAPASPSRDALDDPRGSSSVDASRRNNRSDASSEGRNLTVTETSRSRQNDSGCAEAMLRSLELRSHRNANDIASIPDASTLISHSRAKRQLQRQLQPQLRPIRATHKIRARKAKRVAANTSVVLRARRNERHSLQHSSAMHPSPRPRPFAPQASTIHQQSRSAS